MEAGDSIKHELHKAKNNNTTINADLKALLIKFENTDKYPDNGLTLLTSPDWWISRQTEKEITPEDKKIYNII